MPLNPADLPGHSPESPSDPGRAALEEILRNGNFSQAFIDMTLGNDATAADTETADSRDTRTLRLVTEVDSLLACGVPADLLIDLISRGAPTRARTFVDNLALFRDEDETAAQWQRRLLDHLCRTAFDASSSDLPARRPSWSLALQVISSGDLSLTRAADRLPKWVAGLTTPIAEPLMIELLILAGTEPFDDPFLLEPFRSEIHRLVAHKDRGAKLDLALQETFSPTVIAALNA